ncbi:UPF0280 family protein [bacterium]|nr:UPF0280 family protein [bacterium]MBU1065661.1 UPF0280 family protein [bacterium]MBU1635815.1 UPF0280 family protein [bacterium]MBU1875378.1 UPF0280 family protein [bacterium]
MYEPRLYREIPQNDRFFRVEISYLETDLWIACAPAISEHRFQKFVVNTIISLRNDIDEYTRNRRVFMDSFSALALDSDAPLIVQKMLNAAIQANVGPMAAVAGSFAEEIGKRIKTEFSPNELIVENGGDIYIDINEPVLIGIYAGDSPLSNKIALKVTPEYSPFGICTSSGTIGHSQSFGKADAVTIACKDTAEADAYATAFGNKVQSVNDIDSVIAETRSVRSILSALVIVDDKIAVQGKFDIQIIEH